ncbi:MAG: hypothetical protein ACTSRP_05495 [Candidatus Helarchaeota archaeon]
MEVLGEVDYSLYFFGNFKKFQRALVKLVEKYKSPSNEIRIRWSHTKIINSL